MIKNLGPGILYAAAAIGVSHLVQSTRAGANFGLELIWVIGVAHIFKYPFFWITPNYVTEKNETLLDGYARLGKSPLNLSLIVTFLTMFIIQAAVTLVTAGLLVNVNGDFFNIQSTSVLIIGVCVILLWFNKLSYLNSLIKIVIITLALSSFYALFKATGIQTIKIERPSFNFQDFGNLAFLLAFIGWMPAPMDVPIWQSIWSVKQNKKHKDKKLALLDFHIGFFGTAILAVVFLLLGALVLYPSQIALSKSAVGFTSQLISIYGKTIGSDFQMLIHIAALTTMFSTTITCLDAFPRVMSEGLYLKYELPVKITQRVFLIALSIGTLIIISFLTGNMKSMIDFATILSFIISPFYAFLNYKLILTLNSPPKYIVILAKTGIVFFMFFTMAFLWIKFI